MLAAAHVAAIPTKKTHWDKRDAARRLHDDCGLPDVSELLDQLNAARKAVAYGDEPFPAALDAEAVASEIEACVESRGGFLGKSDPMSTALRTRSLDRRSGLKWPTEHAKHWTRELTRHASVEAVVVIGSVARGRARPGSDLDLVVLHRDPFVKLVPPPEVDAKWVNVDDLDAVLADGDDVLAWAVAFGVVLYDPNAVWSQAKARWRDRLALPSVQVCSERAARASRYAHALLDSSDDDAAAEQLLTMLTHQARGRLAARGIFPRSRPELPQQLCEIGELELAALLDAAFEDPQPSIGALLASAERLRVLSIGAMPAHELAVR